MLLEAILNRVQRHKGFVYKKSAMVEEKAGPVLEVTIRARRRQPGHLFRLRQGPSGL